MLVRGKISQNKFAAHRFYATFQLLTTITRADVLYIVDRKVSTQAPFKTLNKNIRVEHKIRIKSEIGIKSNRGDGNLHNSLPFANMIYDCHSLTATEPSSKH